MADPGPTGAERVTRALAICPLYFILDQSMLDNNDPIDLCAAVVTSGVKLIQLRFKTLGDREQLELARLLRTTCGSECLLIINDRPDIAQLSGADGVHLGTDDLTVTDVRTLSSTMIIGTSAPTSAAARAAETDGADYLGSGAVFISPTKPQRRVIGPTGLTEVVRSVNIPVVGIGGITPDNCAEVITAGAAGYCSIDAFNTGIPVSEVIQRFCTMPGNCNRDRGEQT